MNKDKEAVYLQRRAFLRSVAGIGLLGALSLSTRSWAAASATLGFGNGERELIAYPQKRKLMRVTTRPPHLETPFNVFNEGVITPNDAFFVRYHLANIPLSIDTATYRINVSGEVSQPLSLSLNELKALPAAEVIAVNQCSGNSRGFSSPRVFGAQLGNGSMGNARWKGVPLRLLLEKAGVKQDAALVAINGLDAPVLPSTPDFIKTLTLDHAMNGEPLLAWEMNGEDIPHLNGFPVKLVVPGYFGTYWVKHVSDIQVLKAPLEGKDGFFMNTAYRIPDNACACVPAGTSPTSTRPIGRFKVRSFITSLQDGDSIRAGSEVRLQGIAFDGGSGISKVELSVDGGKRWIQARLGEDLGRFSFRAWYFPYTPAQSGNLQLMVRATANDGDIQPMEASWNPGGYLRNCVETVTVKVI